jgi:hypothetical protein
MTRSTSSSRVVAWLAIGTLGLVQPRRLAFADPSCFRSAPQWVSR